MEEWLPRLGRYRAIGRVVDRPRGAQAEVVGGEVRRGITPPTLTRDAVHPGPSTYVRFRA